MTSTSEGRLPNRDPATAAPDSDTAPGPGRQHGFLRGVLGFLTDLLEDFLGEVAVQAVSCALLIGVLLGLVWGWGQSPALTLSTVVILLTGAVGTVAAFKARNHPDHRWPWLLGAAMLTTVGAVAVWFILYGSNCGCT
ncbi:hypothetical protein [Streptomyces melanogenes]|uniref:hypothetical protein n=1 Tax=Streptomyces melanogenes TaxID=67326 RepID=UPI0037980631